MINLYKKHEKIINYLIFGVLTTIVSLSTYFVCSKIFHMYYLISNIISFIISVLFAFVTNKIYVFKSKTKEKNIISKELISFFSARIFSFVIENITLIILVKVIKIDDMFAKTIVQVIVIILNYILGKLVFKD